MTAATATRTITGLKITARGRIETIDLTFAEGEELHAMYPHLGNEVAEAFAVNAAAPSTAWMDEEGRDRTPNMPNLLASTIIAELNQTATREQLMLGYAFFGPRPYMLHYGTILLLGLQDTDDGPELASLEASVIEQIRAHGHSV